MSDVEPAANVYALNGCRLVFAIPIGMLLAGGAAEPDHPVTVMVAAES